MREIPDTLGKLGSALEEEEYHRAVELSDELEELYRRRHTETRFRLNKVRVAIKTGQIEQEEVRSYYNDAVDREAMKAGVVGMLSIAKTNLSEIELPELHEKVKALRTAERELAGRYSGIEGLISGLDIPPRVRILSADLPDRPVPKGSEMMVSVALGNPGNSESSGTLRLRAGGSITEEEARDISLNGSEREQHQFALQTSEEGVAKFTIRSDGRGGNSKTSRIDVTGKEAQIQWARQQIEALGDKIPSKKSHGGLEAKIKNVEKKLEQAARHVQKERIKSADNQLNAALNILKSLENQAEGLSNSNASNGELRKGKRGDSQVNPAVLATILKAVTVINTSIQDAENADL